ncbi:DUF1059 domain-containing protein [Kineococcus sp. R8]|uniref:DUF1059 domain-containing protein n=1 Tax=Kineococcus siccus TaxID=2696567 RepID=UPI00141266B2|nr:DUF1059 domain-containing protein [Kineococcus siccus]
MKVFRCGDVVPGCERDFLGADRDDIVRQVAAHAALDHGLPSVDDDLARLVAENIRDV